MDHEQFGFWASLSLKNPHPVIRISHRGELLFANAASAALFSGKVPGSGERVPAQWCETAHRVIASRQPEELEFICGARTYALTLIAVSKGDAVNIYAIDVTELKKNKLQLLASEGRFRALIEKEVNGMLVVSETGTILYANPAVERILCRRRESLDGLPFGLPLLRDGFAEVEIPQSDGGVAIAEMRSVSLQWMNQSAFLVTLNDVTEHRHRELLLQRSNHTLAVLSQCKQVLVRASNEAALIEAFCSKLVTLGHYQHAWVGLADGNKIAPCAYAGELSGKGGYADIVGRLIDNDWHFVNNTLEQGNTRHVCLDCKHFCSVEELTHSSRCRDERSMIILPLPCRPRALGVLVIHVRKRKAFDEEQMDLLEQLADDLAFGLFSLRAEQARQASEEDSRRYQVQLEFQATHDNLTGLPNRNLMRSRLIQELNHARRGKHDVAVMFLDLDQFKVINDSLGHRVGDKLLQAIANRLSESVRCEDTVVRYGGDEFVIILPGVNGPDNSAQFARRLLKAVTKPVLLQAHELRVSTSIGVSLYPRDSDDPDTLIQHADAAMYRAKEEGRNQFQFFTAELNARVNQRFEIEMRLRTALEENQLVALYQPQVDLPSGEFVGAEALLRLRHPQHGLIAPGEFISVAEQTGLIVPLGEWMLRTACREASKWQQACLRPITISVNLSAKQLATSSFEACLRNIIEETGLSPQLIEVELTESAIMHNSEYMRKQLDRIKALGVRLAVDDFGTGYSGLAHLREFAFDCLKLDISFVRDITTDTNTASIARAVMAMANSMQLQVIAEGVEEEAQLNCLRGYGCERAQGYYFSRPVNAESILSLLGDVSGVA